ncbi:MAG TPA: hypothetical protein VFX54_02480, partial [Candidatus Binatia bacterium]|nr:hypothetical protein [Candidatus Binatia bacterium]
KLFALNLVHLLLDDNEVRLQTYGVSTFRQVEAQIEKDLSRRFEMTCVCRSERSEEFFPTIRKTRKVHHDSERR